MQGMQDALTRLLKTELMAIRFKAQFQSQAFCFPCKVCKILALDGGSSLAIAFEKLWR
jgi:hypothetical protein